jgi:DinB superfamily
MTNGMLPPVLEDYRRQIESVKAGGLALAEQMTPRQMLERPSVGAWSVVEILDHLRLTVEQYLFALDAAMNGAEKVGVRDAEPRYGWVWKLFLKMMEPPVKRRFRAPKAFEPGVRPDVAATVKGFAAAHEALIERIHRAAEYDLEKVKVVSPASSIIKPPLGCAILAMAAHGRRHLWQARQLPGAELPG